SEGGSGRYCTARHQTGPPCSTRGRCAKLCPLPVQFCRRMPLRAHMSQADEVQALMGALGGFPAAHAQLNEILVAEGLGWQPNDPAISLGYLLLPTMKERLVVDEDGTVAVSQLRDNGWVRIDLPGATYFIALAHQLGGPVFLNGNTMN